jgi:hypothetical protein
LGRVWLDVREPMIGGNPGRASGPPCTCPPIGPHMPYPVRCARKIPGALMRAGG